MTRNLINIIGLHIIHRCKLMEAVRVNSGLFAFVGFLVGINGSMKVHDRQEKSGHKPAPFLRCWIEL